MTNLPVIIGLSVSLLVLGIGFLASNWMASRRLARIHRRIRGEWSGTGEDRVISPRFGSFFAGLERFLPGFLIDHEVPVLLARAGWRGPQARGLFLGLQLLLPVAAILLTLFLAPRTWLADLPLQLPLTLFIAATVGYLLPKTLLRLRATARQQQIEAEVPILVHLLRTLFETGLSLEQSLLESSQTNPRVLPVLSGEIAAALRNIGAGMDHDEALREMAEDLQVQDLTDLMKMLRQMNRYGGSIRQSLSEYAELLEDRRRTKLQERISKMSAKMTVVMVLCMFPALLIFIAGPAAFGILRALGG